MLKPLARPLFIVLISPQIPPNTGNIARLCAVTGCKLILVEPLGFSIEDRKLKRAGLDYWDKVFFALLPSFEKYLAEFPAARKIFFSARTDRSFHRLEFKEGDHLIFGSETAGFSEKIWEDSPGEWATIPMLPECRSLNLSTAVGIVTYEALRQLGATC